MLQRWGWIGSALVVAFAAGAACSTYDEGSDAVTPDAGVEAGGGTTTSSSGGDEGGVPCAGKDCPCVKSADCLDPIFSACEKGGCRECSTSPDSCPADQYCQAATLSCVPGCKGDASCTGAAKHCDERIHRCVECLSKTDCPQGQACSPSGACGASCTPSGGECDNTRVCCNGVCIDTKSDVFNCNGCGTACTGASPLCCNGACKDTSIDEANCGSCGRACSTAAGSPTCNNGGCTWACNAGFSHCQVGNTGCDTFTATSTTQCGGCALNCNTRVKNASGTLCAGSTCDYGTCNAGFVDNDKDRSNGCEAACGTTGAACCAGGQCASLNDRCSPEGKCKQCLPKDSACSNAGTANACCNGCAASGKCN